MKNFIVRLSLFLSIACVAGCQDDSSVSSLQELPEIYPDYRGVTVPSNIAPLNFSRLGEGRCRLVVEAGGEKFRLKGRSGGLFRFPKRMWSRWMKCDSLVFTVQACRNGAWVEYEPFSMEVSRDRIDSWLSYRRVFPGYQGWLNMGLYQRDLGNYKERAILENKISDSNCLNCHSFCNREPGTMLFHSREFLKGTLVLKDGTLEKLNTKTDATMSPLVYPYWHPSGRWVAFSVNATHQAFFHNVASTERIEVYDDSSDVVIYDVENHRISWSPLTKAADRFETFPTFSPDGKWLYFCSAGAVDGLPEDYQSGSGDNYRKVKYALVRIAFDPESGRLGDRVETVFDAPAMGRSVSFPRISPDGRWLAFTLHGWGTFSIWHKDADIWMLDLSGSESLSASSRNSSAPGTDKSTSEDLSGGVRCGDRIARPAEALNSDDVESYHCWSGNGRWLVFSSRRDDGLFTRLYISYVDSDGVARKPFMLPQENPKEFYEDLMFSYNIPELMTGPVPVSQKELAATLRTSGTDVGY